MRKKPAILLLLLLAAAAGGTWYVYTHPRVPPAETIASLQAKLQKNPTDPALHERLAELLLASGQAEPAASHFQAALQYDPGRTSARCGLARTFVSQNKMLDAQKLLEINLQQSPRDPATNELLGDILMKTLGEKTPDIAYPIAAKYFDIALQGDSTREVAALGLSQILLSQGRLSDSARALRDAAVAHPRNAALHLQKARLYALARQYDRANDEYNQATALDPKNSDALCAWGVVLIDANRPELAEKVLWQALELEPKNPKFHMHLARALRDEGLSIADAMKEFERAIDCNPKDVAVYLEIANTLLRVRDDTNDARAERFLRDAIIIDDTYSPAKIALAKLLTNARNPTQRNLWEAADLMRRCAQETKEQDISVLAGYAETLANVKVYDLAAEQMDKAIAWGSTHGLSPAQIENLRTRRQNYTLAQMPDVHGDPSLTFFSVEGRYVHDPTDDPWPFPQQPTVQSLLEFSGDLTQSPAAGSLLDPKHYTGDALPPVPGLFTRVLR